jgi:hypothetical protein
VNTWNLSGGPSVDGSRGGGARSCVRGGRLIGQVALARAVWCNGCAWAHGARTVFATGTPHQHHDSAPEAAVRTPVCMFLGQGRGFHWQAP